MSLIGEKQQEWAALKYLVLSKSQQDYKLIRTLFQDQTWNEEKEAAFQGYLAHALAEPANKGNLLNAYQHVWGYFKKEATEQERATYQERVATFEVEEDQLNPFLKELALKNQTDYLLQSKLLFEEKPKE